MKKELVDRNLTDCFSLDIGPYDILAKETLRPELYDILKQSDSIQRFEGLGLSKNSIEGETVLVHTQRLACRVMALPISEEEKIECIGTVFLHDLPEIKVLLQSERTSDTTATEKALNGRLDQDIESVEDRVAVDIFNNRELRLYRDFSHASGFLKGHDNSHVPTEVGLICKILDKIDADLYYHKAAISSLANAENMSKKGQSLAFEQYLSYSKRLDLLETTGIAKTAILCQKLLNECMLSIKDMWDHVPEKEIPQIIQNCLEVLQIR